MAVAYSGMEKKWRSGEVEFVYLVLTNSGKHNMNIMLSLGCTAVN